jgi:hypothetical protein
MTAGWSHGVYTDEHGTFRRLEIAPKDEPDLVLADFSHDVKQRGTEFEGRP